MKTRFSSCSTRALGTGWTKKSTYVKLATVACAGLVLTLTSLPAGLARAAADTTTPSSSGGPGATPTSGLGGYTLQASAQPVQITLDDPSLPVPSKPSGELDFAYSQARLSTGLSRAVSSLVWPGAVLGDGLPTLGQFLNTINIPLPLPIPVRLPNLALPQYPIKSETTAPQGPFDAHMELLPGATQTAHSDDLSSSANTAMQGFDTAGLVTVGGVTSTSQSTAAGGKATATATSAVSNLSMLAGLIDVSSVKTDITAVSDGAKATLSGTTNVAGVTIAGMAFSVDSNGVHLAGTNSGALSSILGAATGNLNQALAALGISIQAFTPIDTNDTATASRTSTGLVVTIDTAVLKAKLAGPFNAILAALPTQLTSQLGTFTSLAPTIAIVIGSAYVSSAASPTFDFGSGDLGSSSGGGITSLGGSTGSAGTYTPGTPGTPETGGYTPITGSVASAGPTASSGRRLTAIRAIPIASGSPGLPVGLFILILALGLIGAAAMKDMWKRLVLAPQPASNCPLEDQ
ncbi:MAG: choice-of-anchor P family protein [Acidimicrobiales bacterium]